MSPSSQILQFVGVGIRRHSDGIEHWGSEIHRFGWLRTDEASDRGKHLWMQTVGSTVVGQGVDTILVMVLVFGGMVSSSDIFRLVVNFLKRKEGVDVLDVHTKFNPFSL